MEFGFIPEAYKELEKNDMNKRQEKTLYNLERRLNEEFGSEFHFRVTKGRNDEDINRVLGISRSFNSH
jgi:hypothetical protein